jgi:hypothetical protein
VTNIAPDLDNLRVSIDSLTPYRRNPRRHALDAYVESLTTNGQYRPIVVNRRTSEVLAGNGLLAAALRLGWTEVAVTFVDVEEDEAARIVLADNRIAELGTFHQGDLATLVASIGDLQGTGYEPGDLASLVVGVRNGDEDPGKFMDDTIDEGAETVHVPVEDSRPETYALPWGLTPEQRTVVVAAVTRAKKLGASNAPTALVRIAEHYLDGTKE